MSDPKILVVLAISILALPLCLVGCGTVKTGDPDGEEDVVTDGPGDGGDTTVTDAPTDSPVDGTTDSGEDGEGIG